MKVVALVVLVLAISGMEAAVVKREVPQAFQPVADLFQNFGESLKGAYEKFSNQEFVQKFNADELQAQAQDLARKAQEHTEPWRAEAAKFLEELMKKFQ